MDFFLGDKPVIKTTDNKILVREIVNNLDDIIVFNDEAHHIHEKKLAWFKTIEKIIKSDLDMKQDIDLIKNKYLKIY